MIYISVCAMYTHILILADVQFSGKGRIRACKLAHVHVHHENSYNANFLCCIK